MAMIKCRECGREISDSAAVCPHCGRKTRSGIRAEGEKANSTMFFIALAVLVLGGIMLMSGLSTMLDDLGGWYYNYKPPFSSHESSVINRIAIGSGLLGGGFFWLKTGVK